MFNTLSEFYRSKDWELFRRVVISDRVTDDGLTVCEHCGNVILKPYDLILHHIEPLTIDNVNDYSISLNPDNIMLVHHKCHNEIHERFNVYNTRHIYLVYGAPGSGKTTYVNQIAGRHDIVIDMDYIYKGISTNDMYDKPDSLKAIAFAVRDCLLDKVKTKYGKWHNAFIVGGYPRVNERQRLKETLGAEEIFIDTDKNKCLFNISDRPKEWRGYVDNWFEQYAPTQD